MAFFNDTKNPHSDSNGWIHELARAEMFPDVEKILETSHSPQQLIEENTINFLDKLREIFTRFVQIFNGLSESGSKFSEIKIFDLAQTAADFMLYRNQIKLVVSNSSHGVIQLSFSQHKRGGFALDGSMKNENLNVPPSQELNVVIGPFNNIYWTFQNEKVEPTEVARFYFAEYVKLTRERSQVKTNNKILLEQIKSILQKKGLDL